MKIKILIIFVFLLCRISFTEAAEVSRPALNIEKLNAMILFYTNIERADRKVLPLSYSESLSKAAAWQSHYMSGINNLSHVSDVSGMKSVRERILHFGGECMTCGENVIVEFARNFSAKGGSHHNDPAADGAVFFDEKSLAQQLVRRWMESDGHRKNILSASYNSIGTGTSPGRYSGEYSYYSAQVFSGERTIDFSSLKVRKNSNSEYLLSGGGLSQSLILVTSAGEIVKFNGSERGDGQIFSVSSEKKGRLYAALYDKKVGMFYPVYLLDHLK